MLYLVTSSPTEFPSILSSQYPIPLEKTCQSAVPSTQSEDPERRNHESNQEPLCKGTGMEVGYEQ